MMRRASSLFFIFLFLSRGKRVSGLYCGRTKCVPPVGCRARGMEGVKEVWGLLLRMAEATNGAPWTAPHPHGAEETGGGGRPVVRPPSLSFAS